MTDKVDSTDLLVAINSGIATITLNRPEKRNAVTFDMWQQIATTCEQLANDPKVRLLVFRGTGDHFCAGADIAGLGEVSPSEYQAANEAADQAIADFPKPTIAAITGACIGGGTEIAVACDIRIADSTARFGITPARLGIVYPASATKRVVDLIGGAATKQLLYSAEIINAERAERIGLVNEVVKEADFEQRVVQLTSLLAHERSLLTQMASKEIVNAATRGDVDLEISTRWANEVAASNDPHEGVAAFLELRTPNFTWTPNSK